MIDDELYLPEGDQEASLEELDAAQEALEKHKTEPAVELALQPMFQTLFEQSVQYTEPDDAILADFARYVVGPLSDYFGMASAKGGAFFRQKELEGAKNAERYGRDQTLRAHLINGMLPARRIARLLYAWNAEPMRHWDETAERVFVAGFMLHDYSKIKAAKQVLIDAGFAELEAPGKRQIPYLENIFRQWCAKLGLDRFLDPVGGAENLLHDLIYVACNTQRRSGTLHAPSLLPDLYTEPNTYLLATNVSYLADLLAYVAPSPRELVAHETIRESLLNLAYTPALESQSTARLVYHHVAENRGLLLNFIHNAATDALTLPDQRVPLLYAPSGVVYLERHDAPPMPEAETLVADVVRHIRSVTGNKLMDTGKGAKRGNTGLQVDDSYNDFFDLSEFTLNSVRIVEKYIRNNKSPDRLASVRAENWAGDSEFPPIPVDPKDARLDQLAEWAGLLESQFRDRMGTFDLTGFLLRDWAIDDLRPQFEAVRNHPKAIKGGGIKFWWFWAAAHALNRKTGPKDPAAVLEWLVSLSTHLADTLPDELTLSAQASEDTWRDLTDYVGRVLTLGGTKSAQKPWPGDLARYSRAKAGRGGAVCAICGDVYTTRKPAETAVAFQPGVYTGRIKIGASDNKRNLCSICALEQLLRQLFVTNLDSGGTVEGQRVRYLSFYPSYFFTPETLYLMQRVYGRLKSIRISDKDFRAALNRQASREFVSSAEGMSAPPHPLADPIFWQRLDQFLIRQEGEEEKRVLRYSDDAQGTFLMAGFRNFNSPTDSESWVLPALLALVLPICLDVKVIASESGIPLLLESGELRETVWFDGAHSAIRALLGDRRVTARSRENDATSEHILVNDGRLDVDEVLPALARLAAGYLIHLDAEYTPPEEHWNRLPPIASALTESPLYVFHYLKKQEREDRQIGAAQIRRYVAYAETIFNPQGDPQMSYARELVELYRGFYRAKNIGNANSILRPLSVIADALLIADPGMFADSDALVEVAYGELYRFMDRVGKGLADGRFPKGVTVQEREEAMQLFCRKFVNDVFVGVFNKDVAALRGKQLNLLRSACEVIYRDDQNKEWHDRGSEADNPNLSE